jgi:phosphoglycerol transferase MdoB-like AlkP superfamily enzyme
VNDEDLFSMAHKFFQSQPKDRPFFSLVFTSSNHSPWDFPAGKIELYEQPAATRNNAVKYADYALGKFIREARESKYWDNTVFLIIADHCSRVYGAELVPVEHFHIPGVILGAGVKPGRISRVASQIDMLPTLLSLAGVDSVHPNIGIDQTRRDLGDFPGRAVMQYGVNQAYMEGEHVVVLQPERAPAGFLFRDRSLVPETPDTQLIHQAEAFAFWPWISYGQGSYSLLVGGSE